MKTYWLSSTGTAWKRQGETDLPPGTTPAPSGATFGGNFGGTF